MGTEVKFAIISLVYLLLVYLIPIRKLGQSPAKWILCIIIQGLSIFFYKQLFTYFSLYVDIGENLNKIVFTALIVVLNILIILLVNIPGKKKNAAHNTMKGYYDASKNISNENLNDFSNINFNTVNDSVLDGAIYNDNNDVIFNKINSMIESGNKEEALKYLKMIVFYEKDTDIINKAKEMMKTIQES